MINPFHKSLLGKYVGREVCIREVVPNAPGNTYFFGRMTGYDNDFVELSPGFLFTSDFGDDKAYDVNLSNYRSYIDSMLREGKNVTGSPVLISRSRIAAMRDVTSDLEEMASESKDGEGR